MATKIEAVRALMQHAAEAVDDNAPNADALCNMAKYFASEEILKVATHAVELHGGNGMMLDLASRSSCAMPPFSRTWTAPSTYRSSRS